MSDEQRKRAAADALAHSGPSGKKAMAAEYGGPAAKEEPQDDPQDGQSQNNGVPTTVAVNVGGAMAEQRNQEDSAEEQKVVDYVKQIEADLSKLRHDQKKKDKAAAANEEELNKKLTEQVGIKEHLEKKVEELSKKIDELERRPAAGNQENAGLVPAEQAAQEMKRLRQELREAKKKAEDAEKKRSEAAQNAARYERQAEEAEQRAREQDEECVYRGGEMTRLQSEVDQLKAKLERATEGRERRIEAIKADAKNEVVQTWIAEREKLEARIATLTQQVAAYKRQIRIVNQEEEPEDIFSAKLDSAMELYETIKMLEGMTLHLPLKFDRHGLSITTVKPLGHSTVPIVVVKLNPDFFAEYECRKEFSRRVDYKRLFKALDCSRQDRCKMSHQKGSSEIFFGFKNGDTDESTTVYVKEVRGTRAAQAPAKVEYAVKFTMNRYPLDTIAKTLGRIFIKAKQDKVVVSTVENYVGEPSATAYVAKVGDESGGEFSFKVEDYEFSEPVQLCVDPKYLKMCMRPCENSQIRDKFVGISLSKERMQIDYMLRDGSVSYYVPNVAPDPRGERSFSPENEDVQYLDED